MPRKLRLRFMKQQLPRQGVWDIRAGLYIEGSMGSLNGFGAGRYVGFHSLLAPIPDQVVVISPTRLVVRGAMHKIQGEDLCDFRNIYPLL